MKVVLELQDQPASVRRVTVRHDIVIGRGADCNLRLSAPQISRRHCFLRVGRDGVSVTDLDSSNGTFVDGERLRSGVRRPLHHGSQLSLGSVRFVVHIRDESVSDEGANSSAEKQRKTAEKSRSEPSTIVADVDASLRNARAMNLFPEHPGPTTASREMVEDPAGPRGAKPADVVRKRSNTLSNIDSRAEIVDLGRQLIASEHVPLPVPPAVDSDDAPADMSFFDDIVSEKTSDPSSIQNDHASEDVLDVAEVVEEFPDEIIEVVDEEEVLEVAEIVEEIEEPVEVFDDDPASGQDLAGFGNVMSVDDEWEDPDAPARKRRSRAADSSNPVRMSEAARAAGVAPGNSDRASAPSKSSVQSKSPAGSHRHVAPSVSLPPAIPEVDGESDEVPDDEIVEVAEVVDIVEDFEFEEAADGVSAAGSVSEMDSSGSVDPDDFGFSHPSTDEKNSASKDHDDIDPNLRDFLKGF